MSTSSDDGPAPSGSAGYAANGSTPTTRGAGSEGLPMTPARRGAEQARQAKLEDLHDAVQRGSLVIRQMTEEERLLYPVRPVTPRRRRYR